MAHVYQADHAVLPAIQLQTIHAFPPQPQGVSTLWLVLIAPIHKGWPGWVDLGGWSHTEINVPHRELNPDSVTSTNLAWRWFMNRDQRAVATPDDHWPVEMGRMSDYDIRPKPKVWAGSPNECRTFGRTSAECCVLGWNNIFYWWAHWAARKCHS